MTLDRTLKMGMVGGGPGAFIGEVHRKAARLDGGVELVGGAFDINPRKSKQMAKELTLDRKRCYGTYTELIEKELKLPVGERMDFVAVCTPNNWHYPIARALLEAGFHVMCEKPMTLTVAEAKSLVKIVKETRRVFGLMHNYTGYPMVKKLARDLVGGGSFGAVRKIVVKYPQGWLATALEKTGQMQASWRTDPKQSGGSGCGGDIGTHAENLAEYSRAANWMTTSTACSSSTRAPRASFTQARSASVKRTTFRSGCIVKQAASNGTRSIPIISMFEGWASRSRSISAATTISAGSVRPLRGQHACRPVIPRRSWRPSPTTMSTLPIRSAAS